MSKIIVSGTFDVENYGDCLFPIVAAHFLGRAGHDVVSVSPTDGTTRWNDSPVPLSVAALFDANTAFDGAIVGGGNILHNRPDGLVQYVRQGVGTTAYTSLWAGVTLACALRDVPVAWNAPGVPGPFSPSEQAGLVPDHVDAACYVAVRDEESRGFLGSPVASKVAVVPDTAASISLVWPREMLEPIFRDVVAARGSPGMQRFVALHLKRRALQHDPATMAGLIDAMSRQTGLTPILLALAPCHDDDKTVETVSKAMTVPHIALHESDQLKQIAAAIALSEAYVGPSLHGYITAFSYGTPGAIVAQPRLAKFAGFTSQFGCEDDVVERWEDAFAQVASGRARRVGGLPARITEQHDAHWAAIVAGMEDGHGPSPDYLRSAIKREIAHKGVGPVLASAAVVPRAPTFRSAVREQILRLPFGRRLLRRRLRR